MLVCVALVSTGLRSLLGFAAGFLRTQKSSRSRRRSPTQGDHAVGSECSTKIRGDQDQGTGYLGVCLESDDNSQLESSSQNCNCKSQLRT
jgi:hypothetical protein